jgi:hypothetical protein
MPKSLISGSDKLIVRAQRVLKHNDEGSYTVPSKGLYPHQVLWDSCFVAIGRSHYDTDRAKLEVVRLLDSQWSNGMIPHIIFNSGNRYWWDRQIWRSWVSRLSPKKMSTSGVSQPPMLAEAIVRIGQKLSKADRLAWYRSVYPRLLRYHMWLSGERDPRREGLVVQLHPWETGLDTSPPCMVALHEKSWPRWLNIFDNPLIDKAGEFIRVDNKFVEKGERASNAEALALYFLLRKVRRARYNSTKILHNPSFAVQDLTYNCILIKANSLLIEIAGLLGEKLPNDLLAHIANSHAALESLWDEDSSEYYSREFTSNRLIKESSIASLMPLYAGSISKQRAAQLVKLLKDRTSFGLDYPVPSVPIDSPWFSSTRYWQGPTWINTNWFIINGLRRYGFNAEADSLTASTLNLVNQSGFYEYYGPTNGSAHGANNFSWTAGLIIDLANKAL